MSAVTTRIATIMGHIEAYIDEASECPADRQVHTEEVRRAIGHQLLELAHDSAVQARMLLEESATRKLLGERLLGVAREIALDSDGNISAIHFMNELGCDELQTSRGMHLKILNGLHHHHRAHALGIFRSEPAYLYSGHDEWRLSGATLNLVELKRLIRSGEVNLRDVRNLGAKGSQMLLDVLERVRPDIVEQN